MLLALHSQLAQVFHENLQRNIVGEDELVRRRLHVIMSDGWIELGVEKAGLRLPVVAGNVSRNRKP